MHKLKYAKLMCQMINKFASCPTKYQIIIYQAQVYSLKKHSCLKLKNLQKDGKLIGYFELSLFVQGIYQECLS